jgi:ABC-type multidrug transport system permease subunit
VGELPRFWIWMQILIVVFTLAGMVIAITKLA